MSSSYRASTLSCIALLSMSGHVFAQAQTDTTGQPAISKRMVVTPEGAFLVEQNGTAAPTPGGYLNTIAGTRWSLTDGGLAWVGTAVALGNRGTQVFTELDLNNERAMLLSAFDGTPPTPVWEDTSALNSDFRVVDSAETTNTHVSIHQILLGGSSLTRQAVLTKYSSSSGTPDWTYTFTPVINAASNVGISRDGSRIVAAIYNDTASQVEIAVFGPNSGVPQSYTIVPVNVNDYMRGFDLSADGSTLYFSAGVNTNIFDIASLTVVHSNSIGASFDSHAISGDGSVFAYGNFGVIRVWERIGGAYTNTFNRTIPGSCYCAMIDISDDSSTIAYGFTFYDQYLKTIVEAIDVPTKLVTMTHTSMGGGGFQNIISDVSISADGSKFAVGRWGDAAGLDNEVDVYGRDDDAPTLSANLPGSVFSLDMSADGQRVIAGSKAVHANTFGNGGRLTLLDNGDEDFALQTVPHVGATLQFDLYGLPLKQAVLLRANGESNPPKFFGLIGTLYIQRSTLQFLPLSPTDGTGFASGTTTLGASPALIGTSLYYQGLTLAPRRLTKDWVKVTILP
jgi:hypothetical protein